MDQSQQNKSLLIKSFFLDKKNFNALSKKRADLILGELKSLTNITLEDEIWQKIKKLTKDQDLSKNQNWKYFFSRMEAKHEKNQFKKFFIQNILTPTQNISKTLKKTPKRFSPLSEGCTKVFWFHVEDRQQDIYIIGENHNDPGNSVELVRNLAEHIACPIDVFIEKPHTLHWKYIPGKKRSNMTNFSYPPIQFCLRKGKIPKDTQLSNPKNVQFFNKCIRPFKGRVKLWSIDLRKTSIFNFVKNLSLQLIDIAEKSEGILPSTFYSDIIDFQHCFFNFTLFNQNREQYTIEFFDSFSKIFDTIYHESLITTKPNQTKINLILGKDKSPFYIVEHFIKNTSPEEVDKWQKWFTSFLKNQRHRNENLLLVSIQDFYNLVRMYRILKKQKEGILLFFVGFLHAENMKNFLRDVPTNDPSLKLELKEEYNCGEKKSMFLPIPLQDCKEKTSRMEEFLRRKS